VEHRLGSWVPFGGFGGIGGLSGLIGLSGFGGFGGFGGTWSHIFCHFTTMRFIDANWKQDLAITKKG
jgi:hypothetical protein